MNKLKDAYIIAISVIVATLAYLYSRQKRKFGEVYYEAKASKYEESINKLRSEHETTKKEINIDTYIHLRHKFLDSLRRHKKLTGKRYEEL